MLDNFKNIEQHMTNIKDQFYMVSVMQRKKDGEGFRDHVIKSYSVRDGEQLEHYKDEIIALCNTFHARAYFSVCCKSYKDVVREMLHKLVDVEFNAQYGKLNTLFTSSAESTAVKEFKQFVIDIDNDNLDRFGDAQQWLEDHKIPYWINVTVNGIHLITRPFYIDQFKKDLNIVIDVKKNARTVLYYN